MSTRVVNLRREHFDVYIGRRGHGFAGYFGNPVRPWHPCPVCAHTHTEPGETLDCFRLYLYNRAAADSEFRERLELLRGKRLGCFCKPRPCHGDIIVEYLNAHA